VTLLKVSDNCGYIEQLGAISQADLKKQVTIAVAQAQKEANIEQARAELVAAKEVSLANQQRLQVELETEQQAARLKRQFAQGRDTGEQAMAVEQDLLSSTAGMSNGNAPSEVDTSSYER
jgi:hypothetical protein